MFVAVPAQHLWDAAFLKQNAPDFVLSDDRPGAPAGNVFWRSNLGEAGWFLHGYESTWMPAALLEPAASAQLVDALFAGIRHWRLSLHFNKGLAGAPAEAVAAARDTATNPAAADAFALAISAAEAPPAFAGIAGHEPDLPLARRNAEQRRRGDGRAAQAGAEPRLLRVGIELLRSRLAERVLGRELSAAAAVKDKVDPEGLFFVHHGVGSEDWSPDGFTRLK